MTERDPKTNEALSGPFSPYNPPVENHMVIAAALMFVPSILLFVRGLAGGVKMSVVDHTAKFHFASSNLSGFHWFMLLAAFAFLAVGVFAIMSSMKVDKIHNADETQNRTPDAEKASSFAKKIATFGWIPGALFVLIAIGDGFSEFNHEAAESHAVEAEVAEAPKAVAAEAAKPATENEGGEKNVDSKKEQEAQKE